VNHTKAQYFLDRWNEHIGKFINISAKKENVVDAKHQQIVDAACKVFFEKGYHPASMREIAIAADMSLGQIYHYISSKDDVLFLIHRHMQTAWYRNLVDARLDGYEDPVIRLEKALRASLRFLIENRKLIQFIYTESKYLNKEHLKVVLDMDNKNVSEFWCELVKQALDKQGIVSDVTLAGNMISYTMVFIPMRGWNLKEKTTEEAIEFTIDFIFGGLGLFRPLPNEHNRK
jgi:AcrR family transcriptional regulator